MNKPINIQSFVCEISKCPDIQRLKAKNEELKEKIIKLTEENGNLIINRNTVENKLQDTESRLISIQKANIHNIVLLQRLNKALEEAREYAKLKYLSTKNVDLYVVQDLLNEVLKDELLR